MCDSCGCGTHYNHDHHHHHEDQHTSAPRTKVIELERNILDQNEKIAEQNRRWLAERKIVAINILSSPGSGKTYLLEKTLQQLANKIPMAIITGDQHTDNDARRLDEKGAPVRQIETGSACHLDAAMIAKVLPEVVTKETRLLFIENVGNLVCPAAFDLGESFKIALLATTEGEDKPVKYPATFLLAKTIVITKTDLTPYLPWDIKKCCAAIQSIQPGANIIPLSALSGEGMERWFEYLENLCT